MSKIFLFASVPGTNVALSITKLVRHASDHGIKCLHLDFEKKFLKQAGSRFLKAMNIEPNEGNQYSLTQILTLPYKQLVDSCKIAFDNLTSYITSVHLNIIDFQLYTI